MKAPSTSDAITLFDHEASIWEAHYATPYFRDRLLVYDKWLGDRAPQLRAVGASQALDIGCGTFPASRVFANHGISAIGADVSENMVKTARQLKRRAVLYNGADLPFACNTFSLITMINAFEFVTRPAALWAEILRVSTPRVAILMTINNDDSFVKKILRRLLANPSFGKLEAWHSSYSVSSLANIIMPLGFRAPAVYAHSLPTLYEKAPLILGQRLLRNRMFADNIYLEVTRREPHPDDSRR